MLLALFFLKIALAIWGPLWIHENLALDFFLFLWKMPWEFW